MTRPDLYDAAFGLLVVAIAATLGMGIGWVIVMAIAFAIAQALIR